MTQTAQVAPAADNDQGDHGMLTQARRRAAFFDLRHNLLASGSAPAVREAAARHRSAGDLLVCVTADPPPAARPPTAPDSRPTWSCTPAPRARPPARRWSWRRWSGSDSTPPSASPTGTTGRA
ncbi:hypothetical protein GCM10025734_64860 [Kitasatospora paranensis]